MSYTDSSFDAAPAETFNPFPGLRPFETDEYTLFFGREGQSDELLARLARTRFLAVVGTSGSGKSSLIRAGLLPALHGGLMAGAGSAWRVAVFRPAGDPLGNLAAALCSEEALGAGEGDAGVRAAIAEATLRRSTLGVVDVVRQARLAPYENLLLVVDQFEELFRFRASREAQGSEDDAAAFVKLLLEAPQRKAREALAARRKAEPSYVPPAGREVVPVYVVLTMRSDFLGDCAQFQGLPEAINDGQYLIPRMTRDERRAAITGPAAVGGGEISLPLVNRLLNDVGDNPDQLPIMQHALMRTWDHWAARCASGGGGASSCAAVELSDYEAVGGMEDALSRHADEAFNELPDERSRLVAEKIFKALTEKGADNREIRRPATLGELCEIAEATPEEVSAVVETFRREGRSFLMPPAGTPLTPETVIDISHESLIRNWERLKKWVDEEAQSARIYRRVAEAAVLHREGQEGLMADPGLQFALDWRDRHRPNAAWARHYQPEFELASGFLDASREHRDARAAAERERERRELEQAQKFAEEQQRAARRLRRLAAGMVVMFLLSLAAAAAALYTMQVARAQRTEIASMLTVKESLREAAEKERKVLAATLEAKKEEEEARKKAEAGMIAAEEAEEAALRAAVTEKEHAQQEARRANEQARLAAKHAADERAAKEKLGAALKTADAIREASQFFRDARADFDRAEEYTEFKAAYSQMEESIKRFEAVKDFGGVAAAYIKLGAAHEKVKQEGKSQKVQLWDEAVTNYLKIGNHMEVGETLEGIGDELLAQALDSESTGAVELAAEETTGSDSAAGAGIPRDELERFEDKVLKISDEARAEIAARYEAAYDEYRKEAAMFPPNEPPRTLANLISVADKKGILYDSLEGEANRLKAAESYEQSLSLQKANPGSSDSQTFITARLLRLYYELGKVEMVESFANRFREAARAGGGENEAYAVLGIATVLGDHPEARKYAEWAQKYFREHARPREYLVPFYMGDAIAEIEARKARRGQPLSDANYRLALEYYKSALPLVRPKPGDLMTSRFEVLAHMARLHRLTGHTREAAETYAEALALVKDSAIWGSWQLGLYREIGKAQQEMNQLPQAVETYKQYLAVLDSTGEDLGKCETARVRRIIANNGAAEAPPKASGTEGVAPR